MEIITDIEDAHDAIHEMFEKGERPVVSVPRQYADSLKTGLSPHATWIMGISCLVGTFGRAPYIPPGDDRVLVRVEIDDDRQLEPRFTGPDQSYNGIVELKGPIPPDKIKLI